MSKRRRNVVRWVDLNNVESYAPSSTFCPDTRHIPKKIAEGSQATVRAMTLEDLAHVFGDEVRRQVEKSVSNVGQPLAVRGQRVEHKEEDSSSDSSEDEEDAKRTVLPRANEQDAWMGIRLQHEASQVTRGVVRIYAAWHCDAPYEIFSVMPLLPWMLGTVSKDMLAPPQPWTSTAKMAACVRMLLDMIMTLVVIHSRYIYHRDPNRFNIMIDKTPKQRVNTCYTYDTTDFRVIVPPGPYETFLNDFGLATHQPELDDAAQRYAQNSDLDMLIVNLYNFSTTLKIPKQEQVWSDWLHLLLLLGLDMSELTGPDRLQFEASRLGPVKRKHDTPVPPHVLEVLKQHANHPLLRGLVGKDAVADSRWSNVSFMFELAPPQASLAESSAKPQERQRREDEEDGWVCTIL